MMLDIIGTFFVVIPLKGWRRKEEILRYYFVQHVIGASQTHIPRKGGDNEKLLRGGQR